MRISTPPRRLSPRDASFLYMERPNAQLHIGCVAVVDGPIALDALAQRIERRIDRMRRYAQRAVPAPLAFDHPTWEDDPCFQARHHLQRWALPAPGGEAELQDAVQALLAQPLDRSRPLWEMHVIEGLDGGRTALFQKVHHCMVDGIAGAQLLEVLLDAEPDAVDGPPKRQRLAEPLPSSGSLLRRAFGAGVARQGRLAAGVVNAFARPVAARTAVEQLRRAAFSALRLATDDIPRLPWNERIGPRRRLAFTRLPMDGVRRIRAVRGGTVNDVVLSTIAGGLHRQLEANGVLTRRMELTSVVPVSLRTDDEAGHFGNRISAMLVPLAVDLRDEVARYAATRGITDGLKSGAAWVGIDALLGLLDAVPAGLLALVEKQVKVLGLANLIVTNVPGPRETRYLGGARVEALYPIVPIFDGLGLGIAVFSYDGTLHVGLNADADLVPDLDKLRQGVEDAFQALLAAC